MFNKKDVELWFCYFYGLGWALHLACSTEYAVCLSNWVRFLFRRRMPRRINQFKYIDWTDRCADAVSVAAVLVYCHAGSVYPKFFRWLQFTPHLVPSVFVHNWFFHEIWIYGHVGAPSLQRRRYSTLLHIYVLLKLEICES